MIYVCTERTCQCVWAAFPTNRRTETPIPRICPDCERESSRRAGRDYHEGIVP